MKRSILVLLAFSGAPLLFPQTQKPSLQTGGTAQNGALQVRGPENVARQDPSRVVATVDGKPITAKQAMDMLDQFPASQRSRAGNLAQLLDQLYILDRLSSEGLKTNLQSQSPWKEEIALARKRLLAQAYVQTQTTADSARAKAAEQYYNAHANEYVQVKLSGILIGFAPPGTPSTQGKNVRTEEQARAKAEDIEKRLKAGAKFETLAHADSDNPESAPKGGDLGTIDLWAPTLPATIKTAVAALQPGELSEPVQIPNGFYIFKVNSRTQVPFDRVRSQIILQQIYAQYKLQVKDPEFFNTGRTPSLAHPPGGATLSRPAPVPGTPAHPSVSHR